VEDDDRELISVVDDSDSAADANRSTPPWVMLIVDDDRDVHDGTRIALAGARVLGRRIETLHAYSAEQAREMLVANKAIDLLLLDIVMETEDAGLRLVAEIRDGLARRNVRIIIRTGQPGYRTDAAFERNPEIDGYLTKARLTRAILLDAIAAALSPDRGEPDAKKTSN
jgi:CheY-like chemotaxis protein